MKTHGQIGYERYRKYSLAVDPKWLIPTWENLSELNKPFWEKFCANELADTDPGVAAIAAERERQVNQEGWTYSHDDEHTGSELALMAAHYVLLSARDATQYHTQDGLIPSPLTRLIDFVAPQLTPGEWHSKPGTSIRNLEKAGALIAAEISRLKRRDQWELEYQQSTNSKKNAV